MRIWPLIPPGPNDGYPLPEEATPPTPHIVLPMGVQFFAHQPLVGPVDGVNCVYTCALPFISGDIVREVVYRNGIRVPTAEYTATPETRTITFLRAPQPSDTLLLDAYVETDT